MITNFTERTQYRAALIEIERLTTKLTKQTIQLEVSMEIQLAITKTMHILKDYSGVTTEEVLMMVQDFYNGDVE